MLLFIVKKNLPFLLPKNSTITFFSSSSSSASKTLSPSPVSSLLAQHLVNSCGFSSQKAATASKKIIEFAPIHQVVSVTHFFKQHGFTDAHICKLITNMPRILGADVNKTLEPNLQTLREMGFTEAELHLLVASNPCVLTHPLAIPRLEFWQNFLGTDNRKDLVTMFRRNRNLITLDIDSGIAPKITLLKEHGLCDANIVGIVKRGYSFILRSSKSIDELLKWAKELGFDPKTPMFGQALSALCHLRRDAFREKMEIFKGLGWSDEEFLAAVKKAPFLVHLSEGNLRETMEFYAGRVGCHQSYIASNPVLLLLSLEKRLRPRQYVMEVLKSNGIVGTWSLCFIMYLSEKKFVERFLHQYEEQVPKIHKQYIAACAGQILI